MTHLAPANRVELLDVFAIIGRQFDQIRAEIRTREGVINDGVARLEAIPESLDINASVLSVDHPLRALAQGCLDTLKGQLDGWLREVKNHERRTEFSRRFGDSLLVFVFGKVKAGKSSLGNYLAYGASEPMPEVIAHADPKPEFFWSDGTDANESMSSAKMAQQQRFGTGVNETTSSIQGFTLPGLTWVDTPGVHSVNKVNGELASRYVDAADLIVFLTHSSSPGRRSDFEEIATLLKRQKSLMVLITASDISDPEEDAEGQVIYKKVMKSAKDRHDQHEHVQKELMALDLGGARAYLDDVQVHSLSVNYAEEGPEEERVRRWQDSGLAEFAADIAAIANSKGLALKRQTPLRNLASFCAQTVSRINDMEGALEDFSGSLVASREELAHASEIALSNIRSALPARVDQLVDRYALSKDNEGFSQACNEAFDALFLAQADSLCRQVAQRFDAANVRLQGALGTVAAIPGFTERRRSVEYTSRKAEAIGRAAGAGLGTVAGAEAGALLGTMILPGAGTAVGLGIGAMVGAMGGLLGGKLGGAAGRQFNSTEQVEVVTGDNRHEVAVAAREYLQSLAQDRIATLREQLERHCFDDIEGWLQRVTRELAIFRQQLDTQISEINEELAHDAP